MVKRVVSLLAAVFMVCASSFSVSAWSADSFVADSPNYYKLFPSSFASASNSSLVDTSSQSSASWTDLHHLMSAPPAYFLAKVHHDEVTIGVPPYEVTVPAWDEWRRYPDSPYSSPYIVDGTSSSYSSMSFFWNSSYAAIPDTLNDGDVEYLFGPAFTDTVSSSYYPVVMTVDLDISSFGDFSAFEIVGNDQVFSYVNTPGSGPNATFYYDYCSIVVNGTVVGTYEQLLDSSNRPYFAFPDQIYSFSEPITSIQLVYGFENDEIPGSLSYDSSQSYRFQVQFRNYWGDSGLQFSVLSGNSALDGYTDEAQDSINQHDQIEADWVGQMDENFNSLDLDTASYPSGLVSGFQLLSGIFMDIWNGLGDLHLIFTIPLTLGIVLVLIGRISKAVSNRSGRAEEKGDNSA